MKYELWYRDSYGSTHGVPYEKFMTLDAAIHEGEKASKKEVDVVFMIVEKSVPAPKVRGFFKIGKWSYAVDCKRCKGNYWDAPDCVLCKGNGWKPSK